MYQTCIQYKNANKNDFFPKIQRDDAQSYRGSLLETGIALTISYSTVADVVPTLPWLTGVPGRSTKFCVI